MAVMYSKLGGCLGVTAKLGPLARTDLWAGVKDLLDRLMTHLGLGSLLEEPWGGLLGGSGVVVFPGDGAILLGRLGCPVPVGMPMALPDWTSWIARLTCLERASGLGNAASFTGRKESSCLGRTASFTWGKVSSCWERIASFTGGKVSNCRGKLLPLPEGRWAIAREELLPSPKGRWAVAWGELLPSSGGRWAMAGRELLPSQGGRWAIAGGELGGKPDAWLLTGVELVAWLLTGVELVALEGLLTSLEGRRVPAWLLVWGVLLPSLGGITSLPNWLGT